ncbi:MAG: adenylosuccinate lyase [Muribaculaceae bacterium]|nr:adenylosuccinate lyase [Muribaculaceae bacterium]
MSLSTLTAISPVDGRYRGKCARLADFMSEYATIRYRVKVEIEYFIALSKVGLSQLPPLSDECQSNLRRIYAPDVFTESEAQKVKDIENVTNHDVKAVEYYIKEKFDALGLADFKEFIHFGLTSQDINNTAFPMMLSDALKQVVIPEYEALVAKLNELSKEYADVPMLAKTHGQPASPTTLGKEIAVFAYRLGVQLDTLKKVPSSGKFGGATGNFNAHKVAFPHVNWPVFAETFLRDSLGIERECLTTQISNYDNLAAVFDALRRLNTIIIDLDRDFWTYISMNYFKQKIKEGEVGSSAMPHKVNPIDFENSEGNLGLADALLGHLSAKLPISRLQRDLTDSTVIRNIGVPLAHIVIAIESTLKGLGKLILNADAIAADLNDCWSVVAEAIQTILRREAYPKPYEALKALTRTNAVVNQNAISDFIDGLQGISEEVREELHKIAPSNYTGYTIHD